jgi:AcrR family transcriptional regulator
MARPRDPSRDEAIRTATLDLLGEVGYDGVTVRAIAQRAGVSLATMYRRWPTKAALVIDAAASYSNPSQPKRRGDDPTRNLTAIAEALVDLLSGERRGLVPTIVSQATHDPQLAETLRAQIVRPRLAAITEQVAALPGANPDRVDDAAELLVATLFLRVMVRGATPSRSDLRRVVETVTICATAP